MASYTISNVTATSVTIFVSGLTAGTRVRLYIRLASGAEVTDASFTAAGSTFTKSYTLLSPSTSYVLNVGTGDPTSWLGAQSFTTPSDRVRPDNWSWWSAIASGSPVAITASEWNAFCVRINAFRAYRGLAGYGFSTVYSGTPISAAIVNQAVNAIAPMTSYAMSQAVTGGSMTARFFQNMAAALNSVS